MRFTRILALPLVFTLAAGLGPAAAQEAGSASGARPTAPTQPVDPLIGTWTLNVAKSKINGTPPQAKRRVHDYTIDGLILIAYETTSAQGRKSSTHWFLGLDGKEHPEFGRSTGATPIWYLSAKAIDTHTKEITDRRVTAPGQPPQFIYYTFQVSPDGQTFTSTARSKNAQGQDTVSVEVYDREY